MKYTYDNWLNGKYSYDSSLLENGRLSSSDFDLMLNKSYSLVLEAGETEFNRLKSNFEASVQKAEIKSVQSFNKKLFIKLEDDYYNLLLNKVPPTGKGYLGFSLSKFNKFGNYDVELIRNVQKYHSWLTEGNVNLVIRNPLTEQFNPNNGSDYTAAVLAVSWRMYRNYLNQKKEAKKINLEKFDIYLLTIFKNEPSYYMFLELKKIMVGSRYIVADYSFIFHKMKHKSIKAINVTVTEPAFIEFLNKNLNAQITAIKLPFRDPQNKQQSYTTVLNKFKSKIENDV